MWWESVSIAGAVAGESPDGNSGPGVRWGHTCNAVSGGRFLYVFGGYGSDNCQTNDVHVFDAVTQTWSKPMISGVPPSPRDSHSCTTVGDKLFVFGGTDGNNPLKDLHILDTSSNSWIVPNVHGEGPDEREGHSAVLIDKRIFIFGGCGKSETNEEKYYNDIYILDTEKFSWDRPGITGTPPSARDSHSCSSWKNKIVVLGGEDSLDCYLSDVHVLDTGTLKWEPLRTSGHMLPPRAGHTAISLGDDIYVFGGFTDASNLYDDLHILNLNSCTWTKVRPMNQGPSGRFSVAGDCFDEKKGTLVFIGGCNESLEPLDDMYFLHTDTEICLPTTVGHINFEARVTSTNQFGYAIETIIDGKLLHGMIFSCTSNAISDDHVYPNKRAAVEIESVKQNIDKNTSINSMETNEAKSIYQGQEGISQMEDHMSDGSPLGSLASNMTMLTPDVKSLANSGIMEKNEALDNQKKPSELNLPENLCVTGGALPTLSNIELEYKAEAELGKWAS